MDEQKKDDVTNQPQEFEVTELDDKDLEDASGGTFSAGQDLEAAGNNNCNCTNTPC